MASHSSFNPITTSESKLKSQIKRVMANNSQTLRKDMDTQHRYGIKHQ